MFWQNLRRGLTSETGFALLQRGVWGSWYCSPLQHGAVHRWHHPQGRLAGVGKRWYARFQHAPQKTGGIISEQPLIQSTLPLLAENALEVLQQGCLSLSIRRCFFPWLLAQLVQISYVCSGAPAPIPIVMTPLFWTNTHYFNSEYQHWHVLSPVKEFLSAEYKKILHLSNLLELFQCIESSPLCFQLFLAV